MTFSPNENLRLFSKHTHTHTDAYTLGLCVLSNAPSWCLQWSGMGCSWILWGLHPEGSSSARTSSRCWSTSTSASRTPCALSTPSTCWQVNLSPYTSGSQSVGQTLRGGAAGGTSETWTERRGVAAHVLEARGGLHRHDWHVVVKGCHWNAAVVATASAPPSLPPLSLLGFA